MHILIKKLFHVFKDNVFKLTKVMLMYSLLFIQTNKCFVHNDQIFLQCCWSKLLVLSPREYLLYSCMGITPEPCSPKTLWLSVNSIEYLLSFNIFPKIM